MKIEIVRNYTKGEADIPPGANFRALRARSYCFLVLADMLAVSFGFLTANVFRYSELLNSYGLKSLFVFCPAYLIVAFNSRAYSQDVLSIPQLGAKRALNSLLIASFGFLAVLFAFKVSSEFSRLVFAIGVSATVFYVLGFRIFIGRIIGKLAGWNFLRELLIVDDVDYPPGFAEVIFSKDQDIFPGRDNFQSLERIAPIIESFDRVVIACPPDRRIAWAEMMRGADIDVEILAPELREIGAIRLRSADQRTTLLVASGPLSVGDQILKRAFDLLFAACALVILSPIFIIVAVAIRLESAGPVIFRQQRMGSGYKLFDIFKFRSMRWDPVDVDGSNSTSRKDDRLTKVGRFIRRTSIDELPQFINVIRGEMSIVGPRPHAPASKAEGKPFWEVHGEYWDRHSIKPGITGLAQVRGLRGATNHAHELSDRVQADLEYIANWSLWNDLVIIFRTFGVLVHDRAY